VSKVSQKQVGAIAVAIVATVFLIGIVVALNNLAREKSIQTDSDAREFAKENLILPQMDWADVAGTFQASNVRLADKVAGTELLGAFKHKDAVLFDVEVVVSLDDPLFLARFLDETGKDALKAKPIMFEFAERQAFQQGLRGLGYFYIDKKNITKIKTIKIVKRLKA
jgi:hypothetical protein